MQGIHFFLEKFRHLVPADKELKEAVVAAVKQVTGRDLPVADVSVQKWNVYIKTKPALKSEIFLNHEEINQALERALASRRPRRVV